MQQETKSLFSQVIFKANKYPPPSNCSLIASLHYIYDISNNLFKLYLFNLPIVLIEDAPTFNPQNCLEIEPKSMFFYKKTGGSSLKINATNSLITSQTL